MDVVMKILIAVVIGGVLLTIMRNALPGLFQNIIEKINAIVNGITISGGNVSDTSGVTPTPGP